MEGCQRFEVELPIGYLDADGIRHRSGELRKMTGHEEALLYDRGLNAGQLVTRLIQRCLLRLGRVEPVAAEVASALYTPDRNYLLLELHRISLGERLRVAYRCPRCGSELTWIEDLSRAEIRRLDSGDEPQDLEISLEDGYLDRRGTAHRKVTLGLPRGIDEELVAAQLERDPSRARDLLLLRCVRRFGALTAAELEAYGIKVLRDLTMGDRQRLHQALDEQALSVDLRREVHCEPCGARFADRLDASGFFFAAS